MQQITLLGKELPIGIVQSEITGKYGVVNQDYELIVPFQYDYIDNVMSVNGILSAKKDNNKILIELTED